MGALDVLSENFQIMVLAIFGALIGWILGVAYSEVRTYHGHLTKSSFLKSSIYESLLANRELIDSMQKMVDEEHKFPNYPLDPNPLTNLLWNHGDVFKCPKIKERVNWCRYKMEHVNSVLSTVTAENAEKNCQKVFGLLIECRKDIVETMSLICSAKEI